MWHAYWAAGFKPTNQNGVDVQALNNLAIGFPLFLDIEAKLRVSVRVGLGWVWIGLKYG